MINVAETLSIGTRHHQAGQWADAERCYRQALAAEPENARAHYLLGTLALQTGHVQPAIELLSKATVLDRTQASFLANLAVAYRTAGDVEQAIAVNRRAAALDPNFAAPHINLAGIFQGQGNLAAVKDCLQAVLRITPGDVEARVALGEVERELGNTAAAAECFTQAARNAPDNPRVLAAVGLLAYDRGDFVAARASFEAALAVAPKYANARNNLANTLKELRLPEEAEREYRQAVADDPQLTIGHLNLGLLLADLGRPEDAVAPLRTVVEQDPKLARGWSNLAAALLGTGELDEAAAAARRALAIQPEYPSALCDLGSCFRALGKLDDAIAHYRLAERLNPRQPAYRSNLIYTLCMHGGYDAQTLFEEHRAWGRAHADALTAVSAPHTNDRTPGRRLRVGYVSAHFWDHAVNFFSEPILASHDHEQVEVYCYSHGSRAGETNSRLRTYADHWRELGPCDDQQAAELVRRDQIDILVDLSGHIGGNRLLVFARKPAPVQVTYIGYQNTTGMTAMDYRLTDAWADPPGTTDAYYTEKLVRLRRAFFCYLPSADAPPVGPLPADARGYVTFGSFNAFSKVTPEVLAAWARLLQAVGQSRLLVLAHQVDSLRQYLHDTFSALGIAADRWTIADRCSRSAYLRLIADTDIALDPFPFNGHTTTCDALWQGVPVVTLAGRTYAQRFGSSAHVNLGLKELIAGSVDEYVDIAAQLAGDVPRLAALREGLRGRMAASPIVDAAGFTRNLEAAYRTMWEHWCLQPEVGTKY
ncbi:MAG: tetratricopeptide repeat protein [Pirellulales bacterium]